MTLNYLIVKGRSFKPERAAALFAIDFWEGFRAVNPRLAFFASLLGLAPAAAGAETLDDAIGRALVADPGLQSSRTALETSRLALSAARAERLPTISGSVGFTRSWRDASGGAVVDANGNVISAGSGGVQTSDSGSAGVSLSETLYNGGRTTAAVNRAKADYERTQATVRGQEDALVQQVVTAYTGVAYAEAAADIRRQQVERLLRETEAAQTRFDAGATTRTDVYQAQADLAQARADLASAQSDLAAQRATYERRVGAAPGSLDDATPPAVPASLDEAIGIARENSTSVQAAVAGVKAAKANVSSAYSGYLPSLSITAAANRTGDDGFNGFDNDNSSVAARVSIPLFNFGRTPIAVSSAKASERAAEYDLRDAQRGVDEATTQAWARLESARQRIEATRAQLEAATFAANGAELERREGLRTQLEVLQQIETLRNAQLSAAAAERDLVTTAYQLLQTIGKQPRPAAPAQ